ncbi:hypothetical protein GCM10009087_33240 [Sphingomonas oligophenolica]|uniref:Nuclear transport factor 2 family protein n=1 Tax=Sphingomonas oligophenolica TaxID=301154 RepID=A0ABU9XYK1_9SPHN
MTSDERRAIEWDCTRLINHYAVLNDQARWEEVVALYTDDGLMTRPTAPDAPIIGREALLASFFSRPPRVSRHIVGNIVVTVEDAMSASAFSMILLFTGAIVEDGLPVAGAPLVGEYRDRFALTPEGWRFSERRGALSFRP